MAETEILATIEDIQANLPESLVVADHDNTNLIQISVARIIRGYLSRTIDSSVLLAWNTPAGTPELIREIAGKLIASQLYFNRTAQATTSIEERSFAQKLYDEAIALLEAIVLGTEILPDIIVTDLAGMDDLDFFPIDDTDRAFTMGMEL